ncbi:CopG family ribbon-helix-helix protein [Rhodothermus marinus]|jgi:predicted transcriptional regulator|uniref:Transcriptional regulator, CopG family n=1 Tax=Rhodothermus marinus (strain ATCC 43812 / DSM 4252 / R-10) TaxID=518766 RepID=D0MKT2_RHOM4|nr:ribbon-helix-helix protein, CopG family [Rhodothermus marinus]ACY49746.1 transcriptional regulator, CopG family [Rhodothermus marinus DSM 4252]AEN73309.1 CopG-like domain-containing protein DNA-binding domain [Rhodothermus marinus SG0.5JP17-172]MBO2491402.1 ribbon-helix-helix protein, CopG family [Rhodothermus marinus]BBM69550.1 hypothetical protein RmaAA213_13960 [Rhodothermus marinus]BBM72532.1 hypothetical protein RmaAA338_13970 [Rhodothermus marinus]
MSTVLTCRIDDELARRLKETAEETGRKSSEIIREALQRHLALLEFERLRGRVLEAAQRRGYLTDEDVFAEVS